MCCTIQDVNNSGYLDKKEIEALGLNKAFLKRFSKLHQRDENKAGSTADILHFLDVDADGLVTFEEFKTKLNGYAKAVNLG